MSAFKGVGRADISREIKTDFLEEVPVKLRSEE